MQSVKSWIKKSNLKSCFYPHNGWGKCQVGLRYVNIEDGFWLNLQVIYIITGCINYIIISKAFYVVSCFSLFIYNFCFTWKVYFFYVLLFQNSFTNMTLFTFENLNLIKPNIHKSKTMFSCPKAKTIYSGYEILFL